MLEDVTNLVAGSDVTLEPSADGNGPVLVLKGIVSSPEISDDLAGVILEATGVEGVVFSYNGLRYHAYPIRVETNDDFYVVKFDPVIELA